MNSVEMMRLLFWTRVQLYWRMWPLPWRFLALYEACKQ